MRHAPAELFGQSQGVFVVMVKDNLLYECIEERELPENAYLEVLINATVSLIGNETSGQYPKPQAELPHQEFCGYLIQYR